MMKERLQKVLAAAGVCSRRGAEHLIADGRVTVNGVVATVGESADPDSDVIRVDGNLLTPERSRIYLALNKPTGYISSTRSTHGEKTVLALVPKNARVFPVGRLDRDTAGLLLMTNDGEWTNMVTHPRYALEKEYIAEVDGAPSRASMLRLEKGVVLPGGITTLPARVRAIRSGHETSTLTITVTEGRKRQIRLMCAAVGHPVKHLTRVRIGSIKLNDLQPGAWRRLEEWEVRSVRERGSGSASPVGP